MDVTVRKLTDADVDAARVVHTEAFAALDRATGEPVPDMTPERVERQRARIRHFLAHDPGGSWVAEVAGRVAGVALASRRDDLWGLSLLVVDPGQQARGIGRRLLDAALSYADTGDPAVILSSQDPRALRRYASAGFELHPQVRASGPLDPERLPPPSPRVRAGSSADHDFADAVDRDVRGAARGVDHAILGAFNRMLVVDDPAGRGYAYVTPDRVETVVAVDEATATALLWECLRVGADTGRAPSVEHVNGAQQWAVRVAVAAGLSIAPSGPVFWRRRPVPSGYLPSGPYL